MKDLERRTTSLEVRASGRKLEGYVATFGAEAQIGGPSGYVETIAPGAFAKSLAGDILGLIDHDSSKVLGRTRNGTLRLAEDTKGLTFSVDLPPTSYANDILALAERGDLGGASFGFTVERGGDVWKGKRRELRTINLVEVSVVSATPAYPATVVMARSARGGAPSRVLFAKRWLETLER